MAAIAVSIARVWGLFFYLERSAVQSDCRRISASHDVSEKIELFVACYSSSSSSDIKCHFVRPDRTQFSSTSWRQSLVTVSRRPFRARSFLRPVSREYNREYAALSRVSLRKPKELYANFISSKLSARIVRNESDDHVTP
jgi:hypothetical protein